MSTPIKIYENLTAGVCIYETLTQLEFLAAPEIDATYASYFTQYGGKRAVVVKPDAPGESITWTFDKTNALALQLLDRITGQDMKSLFRVGAPSSPLPPGGDLAAMMAAASGVTLPGAGGGSTESGFERKIIYKNDTAHCVVVDYSDYSVVLFCPEGWGRANSKSLTEVAIFNSRMQNNPTDPSSKAPGWAFKKSDPKAAAFLKSLFGEDVMAKATAVPAKKGGGGRGGGGWGGGGRGGGWGGGGRGGWGAQEAPAPTMGSFGAPTGFGGGLPIPGIPSGGLPLPGMPGMGTALPPSPPKHAAPVDTLNEVLNQLTQPMAKAQRKDLTDPTGATIRVGFYGPKAAVEPMIAAYIAEFPVSTFATGIELDANVGTNRAVIMSRTQLS